MISRFLPHAKYGEMPVRVRGQFQNLTAYVNRTRRTKKVKDPNHKNLNCTLDIVKKEHSGVSVANHRDQSYSRHVGHSLVIIRIIFLIDQFHQQIATAANFLSNRPSLVNRIHYPRHR